MAGRLERYIVATPETSQQLRAALDQAINDGSRRTLLVIKNTHTGEELSTAFILERSLYRQLHAEYTGTLADGGIATIVATTHTDLADQPARLTLVRRVTP